MNKLYQNKEWLYDRYVNEKKSIKQIAEICKIMPSTIRGWLKKLDIPYRSQGEAFHLIRANHCELSKEAINWLNGEMLGDGCLHSYSLYSARFIYGSKYLEYIRYISDTLQSFGIEKSGKIRKRYCKDSNYYNYHYVSRCYTELLPIRKQWYPYGKKIVPKDIKLTSLTCRQWYIGDGNLRHSHFGRPSITLHTNNFPTSDVEWLIKQLINSGFRATRQKCQNIIHIPVSSTKDFLDYIDRCPAKCYQYKWDYSRKVTESKERREHREKYNKQYRKDNPEKVREWDRRKYKKKKSRKEFFKDEHEDSKS